MLLGCPTCCDSASGFCPQMNCCTTPRSVSTVCHTGVGFVICVVPTAQVHLCCCCNAIRRTQLRPMHIAMCWFSGPVAVRISPQAYHEFEWEGCSLVLDCRYGCINLNHALLHVESLPDEALGSCTTADKLSPSQNMLHTLFMPAYCAVPHNLKKAVSSGSNLQLVQSSTIDAHNDGATPQLLFGAFSFYIRLSVILLFCGVYG